MITDIRIMLAGLCGGVLFAFLVLGWRNIRWANRFVIIWFCILLSLSASARLFIYEAGVAPIPTWLTPIYDLLFMAIAVSLIISIWTWMVRKKKSRSIEDLVLIRNCLKAQMQAMADDSRHDVTRVLTDLDDKIQKELSGGHH